MSYTNYIKEHPKMSVDEFVKKLGCSKASVYGARYKLKKETVPLKPRPRKKSFLNGDLLDDIKSIKKIGLERVRLICKLLQEE